MRRPLERWSRRARLSERHAIQAHHGDCACSRPIEAHPARPSPSSAPGIGEMLCVCSGGGLLGPDTEGETDNRQHATCTGIGSPATKKLTSMWF
eukprot:scaffold11569_cov29-Tisochrysis_lutea.AAC.1